MTMNHLTASLVAALALFLSACGSETKESNDSLTLIAIQPTVGPVAGGTTVTLTGTGFASGATVLFGGAAASSVTIVNSDRITAVTPPHDAGAVDVQVTNPDNQSEMLADAFTYGQSAFMGFACYENPTTHAEIVNSCPPAGTAGVDKGSTSYAQYLTSGNLPPLP
jgi:hypothetical protein